MRRHEAFTLIELLVVIAIIALLSSVVLASLNSARVKARDARRMQDMKQIMVALNLFYDKYGCLPRTGGGTCDDLVGITYTDGNTDGDFGYDSSATGGFMAFLETAGFFSKTPVDPLNNPSFRYRYYCYAVGQEAYSRGVWLSYWRENGSYAEVVNKEWSDNTICN